VSAVLDLLIQSRCSRGGFENLRYFAVVDHHWDETRITLDPFHHGSIKFLPHLPGCANPIFAPTVTDTVTPSLITVPTANTPEKQKPSRGYLKG